MTWKPKYTLTNKTVTTIGLIGKAVGAIENTRMAKSALARLELRARELSAYASTSIEGNPLPLTEVRALLKSAPTSLRDSQREIVNYNRALEKTYAEVKTGGFSPTVKTLEKIQGLVVEGLMENPEDIGRLRGRHVIISDPRRPGSVVFMPPDFKDVPELMRGMMEFVGANGGNINPVILAGLFHRQNVIIHPFMDGNGRSTRLFTTALLGQGGINVFDIFSFENFYNENVTRYFKAVGCFGDYYELEKEGIDFTGWLEYFAEGILEELLRVQKTIPAGEPVRLEDHHKQVLRHLAEQDTITQAEYARISERSLRARKLDFQHLVELRMIEPRGEGRNRYYVLPPAK